MKYKKYYTLEVALSLGVNPRNNTNGLKSGLGVRSSKWLAALIPSYLFSFISFEYMLLRFFTYYVANLIENI
jgi:hypothetical protein